MHPNPHFRKTAHGRNISFARTRAFGVLVVGQAGDAVALAGPLASHVPFVLSEDGRIWEAHLVRSNPILKVLPAPVLVVVSGPDGYVSPDWYGVPDQVPTWNYIAVHLRGVLHALPPEDLAPHAARLSADFEERLRPKTPWTEAKMDAEVLGRMRRAIVPVAMQVTGIDGTWKLNQNKTDPARLAAAEAMARSRIGHQTADLADWMREPPETD